MDIREIVMLHSEPFEAASELAMAVVELSESRPEMMLVRLKWKHA